MRPSASRATKPVTTTSARGMRFAPLRPAAARCRPTSTTAPSSPGRITSTSRASSQSTCVAARGAVRHQQARGPHLAQALHVGQRLRRRRADQRGRVQQVGRGRRTGCRARPAAWRRPRGRGRAGPRDGAGAAPRAARATPGRAVAVACASWISASVTPCIAETTTTCGAPRSPSRMSATWRMRPASARLEPPNLCAIQRGAGSADATTAFIGPPVGGPPRCRRGVPAPASVRVGCVLASAHARTDPLHGNRGGGRTGAKARAAGHGSS